MLEPIGLSLQFLKKEVYTGSHHGMRYLLQKDEDALKACTYPEPYCFEKALRVIEKETKVDDLEVKLRSRHIKRLSNNECNTEAGIVFLDTLVCMERISDHARNIAEEVLEE